MEIDERLEEYIMVMNEIRSFEGLSTEIKMAALETSIGLHKLQILFRGGKCEV